MHILIEVSFIPVVPMEPQASESTVTLLCRSMRVRIPPSLLLLKDHSFDIEIGFVERARNKNKNFGQLVLLQ